MQQINAPKPPAWRDAARRRAEARSLRLRPVLALLSGAVLLLLLSPPGLAYDEAISFQLAKGAPTAWALFVAMGVTLGYVASRLWSWQNRLGSLAAVLIVLGLGAIAVTDPLSQTHNEVFVAMTALLVFGHFGFFFGHLDFRLFPTTALAVYAAFLCPSHLGIGERLLIAASLAALNVLVYGHLDT